jgi:two-component system, NarL family, invasion response regulator UvrY
VYCGDCQQHEYLPLLKIMISSTGKQPVWISFDPLRELRCLMRRVLLVDDHPAVQRGLRELLLDEFKDLDIVPVASEEAALESLAHGHWELAIVDVDLPGAGGLKLVQTLKTRKPQLRVLIYTMHSERQVGLQAFQHGADGFVSKDNSSELLCLAVKRLLAGRKYVSADLAEQLAFAADRNVERARHENLSQREQEIFQCLLSGKTPSEIAAELSLSIKTVSTFRTRIFEKLRIDNYADLFRYAMAHGLMGN